jgi:hypothetical protein
MANGMRILVCLGAVLLLSPALVLGWNFDYEVYGSILESPARYNLGGLTSGGDGTLEFTLDDTGWPLTPAARFTHIWTTYFADNYVDSIPGAEKWVGEIPGMFHLEATNAPVGYNGACDGTIMAKITVRDNNPLNGILDDAEKWGDHLFDARLSKLCEHSGWGEMAFMWGWGSLASNYFSFKMPPGVDTLYDGGSLFLMPGCTTAVEPTHWGLIKALYR